MSHAASEDKTGNSSAELVRLRNGNAADERISAAFLVSGGQARILLPRQR